jgi:hypothetical protein
MNKLFDLYTNDSPFAPSLTALQFAERLGNVFSAGGRSPCVLPTENHGVQLRWTNDEDEIILELSSEAEISNFTVSKAGWKYSSLPADLLVRVNNAELALLRTESVGCG